MPVPADDPRLKRCGYAKLFGDGGKLDLVMRKREVVLGRPSKGKTIDVQLAEHKAVSREHAIIRYNSDTSEQRGGGSGSRCLRRGGAAGPVTAGGRCRSRVQRHACSAGQ
jgi:hypothetical protein